MANKIIQTPALAGSTSGSVRAYGTPVPNIDPAYQELLDANPYRNLTYRKSPWQGMLEALGFRTQADAWQENMAVQAAEYDAAIKQKAYDEEYNSALSQSERLRAAGQNPDLTGGVEPGEAASLPQDPSTPMQTTGNEGALGELASFASSLMTGFSSALGMVQTFQGIRSNHLINIRQALTNEDEFQKFVRGVAPMLTPDSPETQVLDNGEEETWQYRAYNMAKMFAKRNLPRNFRQKFINSISQFWNSAPAKPELYKDWLEGIKGEKGYEDEYNTFYSPEKRVLRTLYKHLGAAREAITKLQLAREGQEASTAVSEAELRQDVAENTDGVVIGQADTAEAKLRRETAENTDGEALGKAASEKAKADSLEDEVRKILKTAIRDIVKDLSKQGTLMADVTALTTELLGYAPNLLSIGLKL